MPQESFLERKRTDGYRHSKTILRGYMFYEPTEEGHKIIIEILSNAQTIEDIESLSFMSLHYIVLQSKMYVVPAYVLKKILASPYKLERHVAPYEINIRDYEHFYLFSKVIDIARVQKHFVNINQFDKIKYPLPEIVDFHRIRTL